MDRRRRGFTLVELLVALAIFAVVSTMAYRGLRQVLDARARTETVSERLIALQYAMTVIERDVGQAVARDVRTQYGEYAPALDGEHDGLHARVEFTRAGWLNPAQTVRSTLQRVEYENTDGALQRRYWNVLDRAQDTPARTSRLLGGVREFRLRFLDADGGWHEEWPARGSPPGQGPLPRAIELMLRLEEWGEITRLLALPGA